MNKACLLFLTVCFSSLVSATDKDESEVPEAPFCACVFDQNRAWVPERMADPETGINYHCTEWWVDTDKVKHCARARACPTPKEGQTWAETCHSR